MTLSVVAIDYQESAQAIARFWTDYELEPTPYLDPDGSAAQRFGVGLQRSGLPVTIFIGRDGDVRLVFPGEISARDLAFCQLPIQARGSEAGRATAGGRCPV